MLPLIRHHNSTHMIGHSLRFGSTTRSPDWVFEVSIFERLLHKHRLLHKQGNVCAFHHSEPVYARLTDRNHLYRLLLYSVERLTLIRYLAKINR